MAGIITERDILRAIAADKDVDATTVEEVMTREVVSGAPGWDIIEAVKTMTEGGFRHLLVMEMDEPVGIVSLARLSWKRWSRWFRPRTPRPEPTSSSSSISLHPLKPSPKKNDSTRPSAPVGRSDSNRW